MAIFFDVSLNEIRKSKKKEKKNNAVRQGAAMENVLTRSSAWCWMVGNSFMDRGCGKECAGGKGWSGRRRWVMVGFVSEKVFTINLSWDRKPVEDG